MPTYQLHYRMYRVELRAKAQTADFGQLWLTLSQNAFPVRACRLRL